MTTETIRDDAPDRSLYRKIGWRLLPLLIASYMLSYMDRVNIGFAKLGMQHDLGLNETHYGFAAGVFFLGYVMFEVPSNLLLARIGARKTLSRIMVLWGATVVAMMLVRDATTLYVLRFLLGVFEAGFGPGMLYFLTLWYGRERRAQVMSYVLLASPVAGIIGGPMSTLVMEWLNGTLGLTGWQWLFLVEGLPTVLVGVVVFLILDDGPQKAKWLSPAERETITTNLDRAQGAQHHNFAAVLKDPRIYGFAFSYFGMIAGLYALSFWLPTLLKSAGVKNNLAVGFYYAVPYMAAVVSMVLVARHSDRTGERRLHSVICTVLAAIFIALAGFSIDNFALCFGSIVLGACCLYAGYTVFWAIPADYLKGTAAAGGIAFINSIGLIGGFVSPNIIGSLKTLTGNLTSGLAAISALLLVGAIALFFNRLPARR